MHLNLFPTFQDANGRADRLWQTFFLSHWHSVFIHLPVESLIHQQEYYKAIRESTAKTDSYPFIEFILQMILKAINEGVSDVVNEVIKQAIGILTTENSNHIVAICYNVVI